MLLTACFLSALPPGPSGLLNMSVLTVAGLTVFTRMPRGPMAEGNTWHNEHHIVFHGKDDTTYTMGYTKLNNTDKRWDIIS